MRAIGLMDLIHHNLHDPDAVLCDLKCTRRQGISWLRMDLWRLTLLVSTSGPHSLKALTLLPYLRNIFEYSYYFRSFHKLKMDTILQ